jgi:hypothetical protein
MMPRKSGREAGSQLIDNACSGGVAALDHHPQNIQGGADHE